MGLLLFFLNFSISSIPIAVLDTMMKLFWESFIENFIAHLLPFRSIKDFFDVGKINA